MGRQKVYAARVDPVTPFGLALAEEGVRTPQ